MITSYAVKNGMIRVQVNNSSRTFVYPEHKFGSKRYLLREINKSIAREAIRDTKKSIRASRVKQEMDDEIGGSR